MTLEEKLRHWWNNKLLVPQLQYYNPRYMDGNDIIQLEDTEGNLINRFKVSELKYLKIYYKAHVISDRCIVKALQVTWIIIIDDYNN